MIYASELACQAWGLQPVGQPATEPGVCSTCGRPIAIGDLVNPLDFNPSGFTDAPSLVARDHASGVCGYCQPMLDKKVIDASRSILITRQGVWNLSKNTHKKWFLENIPNEPFVLCAGETNNGQHLIWQTPVSLSPNLFYLRVSKRTFEVRMDKIREAQSHFVRIPEILEASFRARHPDKKMPKTSLPSQPFVGIDRTLRHLTGGVVSPRLTGARSEFETIFSTWESLNMAERYYASILGGSEPSEQPERKELKTKPNKKDKK